ncbi:MAG: hypothetical protein JKX97_04160 [Candidatus Lindowbacteria bacterium]|nr:hypothetical protein [Candidatus Lindowbacteria bacterium]
MNDYEVKIQSWLGEGWRRFLANWAPLTIFNGIYTLLSIVLSIPAVVVSIPLLAFLNMQMDPLIAQHALRFIITVGLWIPVIPMAAFFMGGLFTGALAIARGEEITVGKMFAAGPKTFMSYAAVTLLSCLLSLIPLLFNTMVAVVLSKMALASPLVATIISGAFRILLSIGFMLILLPFMFTYFLIADKGMGVFDGLKLSFTTFCKHYFMNSAYLIVVTLISFAGFLACCVGVLFTSPLVLVMITVMYLEIFRQTSGEPSSEVVEA